MVRCHRFAAMTMLSGNCSNGVIGIVIVVGFVPIHAAYCRYRYRGPLYDTLIRRPLLEVYKCM